MAPAILTLSPRILFLDAYDSFSNNIVALVEENVDAEIKKVYIDDPVFAGDQERFRAYLKDFDAVIAGPGPGWATNDEDIGLMKQLWELQNDNIVPVLGICLGFQSLCLAFGADCERLNEPKHGIISTVLHKGQSIFRHVGQMRATQYHSLHIKLAHPIQTTKAVRNPAQLWEPTEACPQLEPLAWDFDTQSNGAVLMGVKHIQKPFWGVQFHPESICTNIEGKRIMQNWWEDAQAWQRKRAFSNVARRTSSVHAHSIPKPFKDFQRELGFSAVRNTSVHGHKANFCLDSNTLAPHELASLIAHGDGQSLPDVPPSIVHCLTTGSGRLTVADVCELLDLPRREAIVLQSGLQSNLLPMAVGTGRYSIIGLVIPGETLRLHYYAGSKTMQLRDGNDEVHTEWTVTSPWPYVKEVMKSLRPSVPPQTKTWAPFWGGLMGYASYEAGLQTINVEVKDDAPSPDVCFAYITRSVVFDHQVKKIYVQSIRGTHDQAWVEEVQDRIYEAAAYKSLESSPSATPLPQPLDPFDKDGPMNQYIFTCQQTFADSGTYCAKVLSCKEAIADGQSYELCLTTRNEICAKRCIACRISRSEDNEHSWNLYKRLTGQNPAPFSAYMRMHNVHILSSSPERYISWDRSQTAQCRPIKGTVQKKSGVTPAMAHEILSSSKERAENLMIVDLTRHQLYGVYGPNNVRVSQLMEVEEYETLWQLVSVIDAVPEGVEQDEADDAWPEPSTQSAIATPDKHKTPYLGFQAFVESLPPGSMTGAPKKRSCEILQRQEGGVHRGIYSGVLGYFDVGGGGDFSVVIRTAIKIDDPKSNDTKEDLWSISAGGAITSQSTPEGEYEEMLAKFQSTSRAFKYQPPQPARSTKGKRVEIIEPDNPEFAELLAQMRNGEELSLDDAQLMLRAVEVELRRRTGGLVRGDDGEGENDVGEVE